METAEGEGLRLVETYNRVNKLLDSEEGKKQMSLFFHSKMAPWQVPINSDYGKQNLQKMAKHLSLVFSVDFIYENRNFMGQSHMCISPIEVQWKKEEQNFVRTIDMRHVMRYNSKAHLEEGLEFLALAKLVELGFPGFVRKDNKIMKNHYGLIASAIGPPCFRETPLGRPLKSNDLLLASPVYPVIRFQKADSDIRSIYAALRRIYLLSLINENRRLFPAMELYNFRMFMVLLPYIANKSNNLLANLGMAALEKQTNSFKRDMDFTIHFWDQLEEINTLIETHGFELLLASLCSNNDPEKVRKYFPAMVKVLPQVDTEKGFSDEQIILIFNVIKELYQHISLGESEDFEFGGEFFAMVGKVKVKRGSVITFK